MLNVGSSHSGDGGNINLEAGQSSGLVEAFCLQWWRKNLEVYQFSPTSSGKSWREKGDLFLQTGEGIDQSQLVCAH